ncbi:hypothetical protein HDZ31DRAFT_63369 [Schizophyllum fasciatum]
MHGRYLNPQQYTGRPLGWQFSISSRSHQTAGFIPSAAHATQSTGPYNTPSVAPAAAAIPAATGAPAATSKQCESDDDSSSSESESESDSEEEDGADALVRETERAAERDLEMLSDPEDDAPKVVMPTLEFAADDEPRRARNYDGPVEEAFTIVRSREASPDVNPQAADADTPPSGQPEPEEPLDFLASAMLADEDDQPLEDTAKRVVEPAPHSKKAPSTTASASSARARRPATNQNTSPRISRVPPPILRPTIPTNDRPPSPSRHLQSSPKANVFPSSLEVPSAPTESVGQPGPEPDSQLEVKLARAKRAAFAQKRKRQTAARQKPRKRMAVEASAAQDAASVVPAPAPAPPPTCPDDVPICGGRCARDLTPSEAGDLHGTFLQVRHMGYVKYWRVAETAPHPDNWKTAKERWVHRYAHVHDAEGHLRTAGEIRLYGFKVGAWPESWESVKGEMQVKRAGEPKRSEVEVIEISDDEDDAPTASPAVPAASGQAQEPVRPPTQRFSHSAASQDTQLAPNRAQPAIPNEAPAGPSPQPSIPAPSTEATSSLLPVAHSRDAQPRQPAAAPRTVYYRPPQPITPLTVTPSDAPLRATEPAPTPAPKVPANAPSTGFTFAVPNISLDAVASKPKPKPKPKARKQKTAATPAAPAPRQKVQGKGKGKGKGKQAAVVAGPSGSQTAHAMQVLEAQPSSSSTPPQPYQERVGRHSYTPVQALRAQAPPSAAPVSAPLRGNDGSYGRNAQGRAQGHAHSQQPGGIPTGAREHQPQTYERNALATAEYSHTTPNAPRQEYVTRASSRSFPQQQQAQPGFSGSSSQRSEHIRAYEEQLALREYVSQQDARYVSEYTGGTMPPPQEQWRQPPQEHWRQPAQMSAMNGAYGGAPAMREMQLQSMPPQQYRDPNDGQYVHAQAFEEQMSYLAAPAPIIEQENAATYSWNAHGYLQEDAYSRQQMSDMLSSAPEHQAQASQSAPTGYPMELNYESHQPGYGAQAFDAQQEQLALYEAWLRDARQLAFERERAMWQAPSQNSGYAPEYGHNAAPQNHWLPASNPTMQQMDFAPSALAQAGPESCSNSSYHGYYADASVGNPYATR